MQYSCQCSELGVSSTISLFRACAQTIYRCSAPSINKSCNCCHLLLLFHISNFSSLSLFSYNKPLPLQNIVVCWNVSACAVWRTMRGNREQRKLYREVCLIWDPVCIVICVINNTSNIQTGTIIYNHMTIIINRSVLQQSYMHAHTHSHKIHS